MSSSRKLLLWGGIGLAALGMLYGLYYAIFVEHQTLDRMGGSLTQAFLSAAQRNIVDAHNQIDAYASTKYEYVRQVDVHSHWIGLAMVLIVLGIVLDNVGFTPATRMWIAAALVAGAFVFPLGVILQTATHRALASGLAILGSAAVTIALGAVVWGFARSSSRN